METPTLHTIPLHEPFAARLADRLLEASPAGAAAGDLGGALVVLPSVRACSSLRHALLERSGRAALLLPDILTPPQLVAQLAGRIGLSAAVAAAPPAALRSLLLAGRLAALPWVAQRRESAAGLAEELLRAFDEARLADAGWLLDAAVPAGGAPGAAAPVGRHAEIQAIDLGRLRAAFAVYRRVVPADEVDLLVDVANGLDRGWPGPAYARVTVAGFAEVDAVTARILRAALAAGAGQLCLDSTDDPLCGALLRTYGGTGAATHPLAPARRLRALLAREATAPTSQPGDARRTVPDLLACGDPEEESRVVAGVVVEELRRTGGNVGIAVATADRALARRVVAQLRDAGVDVDDTGGLPLAALPAGRLCHFLLQCAVSGLRHDPLLEVLTHPWVSLLASRRLHSRRTLLLEKLVLRGEAPPAGLAGYRERAEAKDEAYRGSHGGAPAGLTAFVDAVGAALGPLLAAPAGAAPWRGRLEALRAVWGAAAAGAPLRPDPALRNDEGRDGRDAGLVALGGLLDRLDRLAAAPDALPDVTLEEFAAALDRLLAAETVRPHRSPFLPVQVMGLIEARLERFDLLVVAGANEEVFPGRLRRPLFLGDAARDAAGLPTWRERLGLQGELFLRLLHGADRVVITWARERGGQPALPSPLVERLTLGLGRTARAATPGPLYRKRAPDLGGIRRAQAAFAAEPGDDPLAGPRVEARSIPLRASSHSGLEKYRRCPYRFLLEKGYGLSEQEEVLESFRKLDHGNTVHECLRLFLEPDGAGRRLLAAGDEDGAVRELRQLAAAQFAPGAGAAPQRGLWEETFTAAAPAIVARELARAGAWRPRALEQEFRLTLGGLRAWLVRELAGADGDGEAVPPAPLTPTQARIGLTGWIDRVDVDPSGRQAAVIDYKTGNAPKLGAVRSGDEPQLTLYAVAVETGAVTGLEQGLVVTEAGYYVFKESEAGLSPRLDLAADGAGRAPLVAGARRILQDALGAADRERAFPLLPEYRDGTLRGNLPCPFCPLRGVCRVDERELPAPLRARLAQSGRSR